MDIQTLKRSVLKHGGSSGCSVGKQNLLTVCGVRHQHPGTPHNVGLCGATVSWTNLGVSFGGTCSHFEAWATGEIYFSTSHASNSRASIQCV